MTRWREQIVVIELDLRKDKRKHQIGKSKSILFWCIEMLSPQKGYFSSIIYGRKN